MQKKGNSIRKVKQVALLALAIGLPLGAFAQATCKRTYTGIWGGIVLVTTECSNSDSNTFWFEHYR